MPAESGQIQVTWPKNSPGCILGSTAGLCMSNLLWHAVTGVRWHALPAWILKQFPSLTPFLPSPVDIISSFYANTPVQANVHAMCTRKHTEYTGWTWEEVMMNTVPSHCRWHDLLIHHSQPQRHDYQQPTVWCWKFSFHGALNPQYCQLNVIITHAKQNIVVFFTSEGAFLERYSCI